MDGKWDYWYNDRIQKDVLVEVECQLLARRRLIQARGKVTVKIAKDTVTMMKVLELLYASSHGFLRSLYRRLKKLK